MSITVDNVTPTVLVPRDPMRSGLMITCPSADAIRMCPEVDPTATQGWLLSLAVGLSASFRLQDDGRLVQAEWRALATGAAPVTVFVIVTQLAGIDRKVGAKEHGNRN